eukprot:CAMPEP_0205829526 /NCGR_PEP_ID=MMETSP0206-20130828/38381_1 /ASSEMBLY_ACC=CAM_ASM_000279 /TAXON_ID=36767 /ORGANISM="Euplotes focardii, Strain TN1" /LENGTH=117 /DNA_ID=CAMNT_0053132319 /DNA_START=30 /DNA_END=383 /DNA_ORIENTATION=+
MRIIAAYMLAVLGGNAEPDEKAVTDILDSVGVKPDAEALKVFFEKVKGKDLDALLEAGKQKLVALGGLGGGPGAGAAAGGEEAAAEKEAEPETDSDDDEPAAGGMDIFGGDDEEEGY